MEIPSSIWNEAAVLSRDTGGGERRIAGEGSLFAMAPPIRRSTTAPRPSSTASPTRAGIAAIGLSSGPLDDAQLKDAGAIAVYSDVGELLAEFDRSPLAD